MDKSKIMIVISGVMIAVGLVLSVAGEQIILEDIIQERDEINLEKTLTISSDFDNEETDKGIFNVQIMNFKENTFYVKVIDPFETEIISYEMDNESIEEDFEIFETGTYKLIIKSTDNEENLVVGSLGPLPDSNQMILRYLSMYILLGGMIGLLVSSMIIIKNRKKLI
jgi:hypothetical protein